MKLDINILRGMLSSGIEYRGKHVGWEQVEHRFARDAEIIVFACKAAVSETLLQRCSQLFQCHRQRLHNRAPIPPHLYRGKSRSSTETRSRWMGRRILTTSVQQLSRSPS